jgi:predicted dehydrogenase
MNMAQPKDLTRREVVKAAGAASVIAAARKLEGAPAIQTVKAANSQVQFGMIGTGSRGSYLLKHLKGIDNGRCVAVCDINQDHLDKGAATIGTNPDKFKDYRELLAKRDVDAVFVVTPLFLHFPITKDTLEAGKNTFCEKSLVFKPEEAHALRALANSRPKQILQVGLQRRYSHYYQILKDMVDKGILGNVTHVHAQWHRNPGWTMKPDPDPQQQRMNNWRLFREYSGGLAAELASHQVDVADWLFGSSPEYVIGVGGLDVRKDGRDIFDNIQLIYKYPKGQKMTIAMWFKEPQQPKVTKAGEVKENWKAGATMVAGGVAKGLPIVAQREEFSGSESFLDREMKFARRWLYAKGVMVPEEERNPVGTELESFFNSCRDGKRPRADLEVGLADSTAVILSNLAMDEERRVYFSEMEKMGRGNAQAKKA